MDPIDITTIKNKDEFIQQFIEDAKSGKIPFPYLYYSIKNNDEIFNNIRNHKTMTSSEPYEMRTSYKYFKTTKVFFRILADPNEYFNTNVLTDLYSEDMRMKCVVKGNKPPIDRWKDPDVLKAALALCFDKFKKLDNFTLHEALWETNLIKQCTNYKPTVCVDLVRIFGATKVLDLSCGWGDRLIGFLAAGVEVYDGCDPSPDMHDKYAKIVEAHGSKGMHQLVDIQQCKAEDYEVKQGYYDLFHSSPPFWTKEIYATNDPNVSYKDWLENFLFVYLMKAYRGLRTFGILTIYISDFAGAWGMCDIMNDFISMQLKCKQLVPFGIDTGSSIYPIWCWQKVD